MNMNKYIRAYLERKEKLLNKAKTLHGIAKADGRELTASEQSLFDDIMSQIRGLDLKIEEEREQMEAERNAPAIDQPNYSGALPFEIGDTPPRSANVYPVGGRMFSQMFPLISRSTSGFNSFGDFLRTIHGGLADPRMINAAAGSSEGIGVDGGFLVPTQYTAEVMDASLEDEIVRPRAAVRPMLFNSLNVGGFNTLNHSSSIGGFAGDWFGEGTPLTVQKGLIRNLLLKANKLGVLTSATNELISDSSYFENELRSMIIKAIGWYLDLAFFTGDGVAKPRGVLNDPALITVSKEVGQAADTITWENIKAMYGRLHPASLKNAVWVASANTKVQLLSMVQLVKNVAGSENVGGTWIPVLRDDGSGGFTLLGIPVKFTEKTPTLGDKGDIMLCDFSQYIIGLRSEMTLDKSGHVGFTTDETYYRAIIRADGMGRWSGPMTPKNGATLSWAVTLEAR